MTEEYDVIIIGAGANGLMCGSYLAKAGAKVAIVEKNPEQGAAAKLGRSWGSFPEVQRCLWGRSGGRRGPGTAGRPQWLLRRRRRMEEPLEAATRSGEGRAVLQDVKRSSKEALEGAKGLELGDKTAVGSGG